MPDFTRDKNRILHKPSDGDDGAPGAAPAGPTTSVATVLGASIGACAADVVAGTVSNVAQNLDSVAEAAAKGAATGGFGGAAKAAAAEVTNLAFEGGRQGSQSPACDQALAENAARANEIGLGGIVAP